MATTRTRHRPPPAEQLTLRGFGRLVTDEVRRQGHGEPEAPFQRHSETSQEAAEAIDAKGKANKLRVAVYLWLCRQGSRGGTDEECQTALKMGGSTQRPRRVELTGRGLVGDSQKKRPTVSGRSATVWVALPLADGSTPFPATKGNTPGGA